MKAIVATHEGGPEVLMLQELPAPEPRVGEVVVAVETAGINFADLLAARGKYSGGPKPPFIAGREFCGTRLDTKERVMGYCEYGAFAEQVAVTPNRLWPAPKDWTASLCAAFPVNYFTAWLAYWKAGLLKGDVLRPAGRKPRVLIHAVAGGVGTAAVEIGKLLDVETYGTSSSDAKLQGAFELGLTHGINYTHQDYEELILEHTRGEGVDAVFEMLGGEATAKSIRTLGFNGRCILYGTASGKPPQIDVRALYAKAASVHGLWLGKLVAQKELMDRAWRELSAWIEAGHLRPVVGHTLPLEDAAEAFRTMQERRNFGKIVVTVKRG